ncbi:hypothetical protein [Spartinivicinus ruber]|uniref:hypothetical protein n=1 Tax=Spartinivicinus ruber TaxID=2683272 RepID=UPI0013D0D9A3|nr:hypothetical protein [Spartinivicinus ruber]
MNRYLIGISLLPVAFIFSASSTANEGLGTIESNIESVLMAPKSETDYQMALKIKKMISNSVVPSDAAISAARSVCYSSLPGRNTNQSLIMVPLPDNKADLDAVCHVSINSAWHAGGIAKGNYFYQNCSSLDNKSYGGGYTSYVNEKYFEANRSKYSSCKPTNAFVCCSPQFPN